MCANPKKSSCWVLNVEKDVIDTVFTCMWEHNYSVHSFFNLIERAYTVAEEKAIYLRFKREGLLDNW